jgi:D-sedoheptulose 7-phosphate isomerase
VDPHDPHPSIERLRLDLEKRRDIAASLAPLLPDLAAAAEAIAVALRSGGKVLLFGNGGSHAQALHLEAELVGRFSRDRRPLAAIALGASPPTLTALGNDFGGDHVFERALEALARKEDVAVAFSTSGRSRNVLAAMRRARSLSLRTIAFLGRTGGELAPLVDLAIRVPLDDTALVQEAHQVLVHLLAREIEIALPA